MRLASLPSFDIPFIEVVMPNIRTYLQTKNGAGGPHLIGPTDFVQWATANVGDYQRGEISLGQLQTMLDNLFKEGKWPNKGVCVRFTVGVPYTGAVDDLARGIAGRDNNPPKTFVPDVSGDYHRGRLMKVTKMMCAFAMNMEQSPYPACRHYYAIEEGEAQDGLTKDFVAKHVSSTGDDKSTKKVAQIRGAQVPQRQGIQAFGNIVTTRSGGLLKEEVASFCAEIKSRQAEFTQTYEGLSQFFAENCGLLDAGGNANFQVLFDGVTFISQRAYRMYEYENGRGGEESVFIHFGVSCTPDGKKWAVHHLARTSATRTIGSGTAATIFGATDATTSVSDPY